MIYKKLGEDLLELSAIGQGIGLYDWNDSHIRVMQAGIDLGMNFFDTAEDYDDGNSEIIEKKRVCFSGMYHEGWSIVSWKPL